MEIVDPFENWNPETREGNKEKLFPLILAKIDKEKRKLKTITWMSAFAMIVLVTINVFGIQKNILNKMEREKSSLENYQVINSFEIHINY